MGTTAHSNVGGFLLFTLSIPRIERLKLLVDSLEFIHP